MELPQKEYLARDELAERWNCRERDINYFVANGDLRSVIFMPCIDAQPMSWTKCVDADGTTHLDLVVAKDTDGNRVRSDGVEGFVHPHGFRVAPDEMLYQWFSTSPDPEDRNAACFTLFDEEADWRIFDKFVYFEIAEVQRFEREKMIKEKKNTEKQADARSIVAFQNKLAIMAVMYGRIKYPDKPKLVLSQLIEDINDEKYGGYYGVKETSFKNHLSAGLRRIQSDFEE